MVRVSAKNIARIKFFIPLLILFTMGNGCTQKESSIITPDTFSAPQPASPATTTETTTPISLAQKLTACHSLPNGSVQKIAEASTIYIDLPKDIFPEKDRGLVFRTIRGNATARDKTQYDLRSGRIDGCRPNYYEFDGNGEVDLTVKSQSKDEIGHPLTHYYVVRFLVGNSPTSATDVTQEMVLNSNGFRDGERFATDSDDGLPVEGMNTSTIVFGDLDGDGKKEGVVSALWCGASCGQEILVFKDTADGIDAFILPENFERISSKDTVTSLRIKKGSLTVTRQSRDMLKNISLDYKISFTDGALQATNNGSTRSTDLRTYYHVNPTFSFDYPLSYDQNEECLVKEDLYHARAAAWMGTVGDGIEIIVTDIPSSTTLASYFEKLTKGTTIYSKKTTTISGNQAIEFETALLRRPEDEQTTADRYEKFVMIKKNNRIFSFSSGAFSNILCEPNIADILQTFNKIVKSFKF